MPNVGQNRLDSAQLVQVGRLLFPPHQFDVCPRPRQEGGVCDDLLEGAHWDIEMLAEAEEAGLDFHHLVVRRTAVTLRAADHGEVIAINMCNRADLVPADVAYVHVGCDAPDVLLPHDSPPLLDTHARRRSGSHPYPFGPQTACQAGAVWRS